MQNAYSRVVQIDGVLRSHQQAIYAKIFSELSSSGAAYAAARQLKGMQGLIASYASLLLPHTMGENEYVESLLAGDQPILGDTEIVAIYNAARSSAIPDTTKKIDFTALAENRISALQDTLKAILTKINGKQADERLDLVSDVLERIQLYKSRGSGTVDCTYSVTPPILQASAAGGTLSVTVDTGTSCAWNVTAMPNWAHSNGSGVGPLTLSVTLIKIGMTEHEARISRWQART